MTSRPPGVSGRTKSGAERRAYARRVRRSRQNPAPARPAITIASVHGEVGAPDAPTAAADTVIAKAFDVPAAFLPLCARPRRAAAWVSGPGAKAGTNAESVTVTEKLYVPAASGVPEIVIGPSGVMGLLKCSPSGSEPAVIE